MERDGRLELDKASRHHNRVPMETCFSEPKICSNCNLQCAGEIWIYECLCVYECFCAYECLCAIAQQEFANM